MTCACCKGQSDNPDGWLCVFCYNTLFPDWKIGFMKVAKKQGVDGSDYRGGIFRKGQWQETEASKKCPAAKRGGRFIPPRCGE